MKKLMTLLAVAIMAILNANGQNSNLEPVDLFVWGSGEAAYKVADDTILASDLDGTYKGYLPVVIECPGIAEILDLVLCNI